MQLCLGARLILFSFCLLLVRAGTAAPLALQHRERVPGSDHTPVQIGIGYQKFHPQGVTHGKYWMDHDLSQSGNLPMVSADISWSPATFRTFDHRLVNLGLFAQLNYAQDTAPLINAENGQNSGNATLQSFISLLGVQNEMHVPRVRSLFVGIRPALGTVTYVRKTDRTDRNDSLDALIYSLGAYVGYDITRKVSIVFAYDYRGMFNRFQLTKMNVQNENVTLGLKFKL